MPSAGEAARSGRNLPSRSGRHSRDTVVGRPDHIVNPAARAARQCGPYRAPEDGKAGAVPADGHDADDQAETFPDAAPAGVDLVLVFPPPACRPSRVARVA